MYSREGKSVIRKNWALHANIILLGENMYCTESATISGLSIIFPVPELKPCMKESRKRVECDGEVRERMRERERLEERERGSV